MATAPIVKRRKGRPLKEESTAIAMEKAMLDMKSGFAKLVPKAVAALEGLLTTGSEKVKEGTAKFIIQEAKEIQATYVMEDNDKEDETGDSISVSEPDDIMPLTTEIREYKMAEGED